MLGKNVEWKEQGTEGDMLNTHYIHINLKDGKQYHWNSVAI